MTQYMYLPRSHYLQAPAEQDYPDLRWQSLRGPVHHHSTQQRLSVRFHSIMFLIQLFCRFISVTIRPACHNQIPSHLVLPPYAAAQQEHSGHKYENWNWTKFVFPPTRNCVIWHSGNIFARINSKWDDQPVYYFANDNDPFWHSEWAFFECDI